MVPLKSRAKFRYKAITSYRLPIFPLKPCPLIFVPLESFHVCFVTINVDFNVDLSRLNAPTFKFVVSSTLNVFALNVVSSNLHGLALNIISSNNVTLAAITFVVDLK
jgi:hypothetical protein